MTITLPVHPLRGVPLVVIRDGIRARDGRRYVEVEHPGGWALRVPVDWTDQVVGQIPGDCGGRTARSGPASRGLRTISRPELGSFPRPKLRMNRTW